MSLTWDTTTAKAQFRLTSQRLRQLQDKKDAQGFIVRKDIATLLRQGNIWLARAKAQGLLIEETSADLLERVDMHIGVLLQHLNELDLKSLSPVVVEAVVTIIHVAPHIESQDLHITRNILVNHLGSDFLSSITGNLVSPIVIRALAFSAPSASEINACLRNIALSFNVPWEPEPSRHDNVRSLSEMLNQPSSMIDISQLRKSCCHGIPDEPVWLRPRIWRLLFGMTSPAELSKRRDDYYDLVQRLLNPFTAPETTSTALSSLDVTLLDISKQLSRIPSALFLYLDGAPDISTLCPLYEDAPDDIKIHYANILELRLAVLRDEQKDESATTPEIRVEMHESSDDMHVGNSAEDAKHTTILPSNTFRLPGVHPRHSSALLRILYLHATINPGVLSPHVPSLLIPLYAVLAQEVEPEHSAHTEADAFWLFEAMLGEFVEFEDEQAITTWLHKFAERVAWADRDLFDLLHEWGLDPALPHYSYRWLTTLLTHTLPSPAVIVAWDVLFSRPMRMRSSNYKMDHLLDICTAMLLCLRPKLLRLGGGTATSRLLWSEHDITRVHRRLELNDAFMEGVSLLQNYPIEAAGGVDRILQTASDLLQRRLDVSADTKTDKVGLGMRIRDTMWKGFTNQLAPPAESPEPSDDDSESSQDENNETETLWSNKSPSFTSRLATTVWKGITNQTAMEPPPSPPTPSSPITEPPLRLPSEDQKPPNVYNGIWNYAEKLKDSDTVAALSKVSSNWRARALIATRGHPADHQKIQESQDKNKVKTNSLNGTHHSHTDPSTDSRRSSVYSPPPRPAYFRSPRDSYTSSDTDKPSSSHTKIPPTRSSSDLGIISKTRASLTALISPPPKSAPKPLLLSSSSLITPVYNNGATSRHPHSAPALGQHDWMGDPRVTLHRDSLSSVSSVSTPEAVNQSHRTSVSGRDSDTDGTTRRILLNRKSVSPLYRTQRPTFSSRASSVTLSDVGQETAPNKSEQSRKEPQCIDIQDCTPGSPLATSPPVLYTPSSIESSMDSAIHVTEHEKRRGSILLEGSEGQVLVTVPQPKKFVRKKASTEAGDTTDSSIASLPLRSVRVRTRRHQAQPAGLRLQAEVTTVDVTDRIPSPNALRVEWPTEDQDTSVTPKASEFDLSHRRSTSPKFAHKLPTERKSSGDGRETRIRKVSGSQVSRKTSIENRETQRNSRDSAAEEGDDEGYDDLLSAYESEESVTVQIVDGA